MEINDELRELILVGASALELKKKAVEQGMITLRRSGLTKVALGQTTLEEVLARNGFVSKRGCANGWDYTERITEENDRDGRQRPAHHHQQRAARARSRQAAPAGHAASHGG